MSTAPRWLWPAAMFAGALLARLYFATRLFLNPDEALHYLLSAQISVTAAYHASLTTAHPPLLILFLYYWRSLGHSEIVLRLPAMFAGLLFSWMSYQWIQRIANRETAQIALPLLLFAPPLISLSAEVRQYAFLLLFISMALYCFERALDDSSAVWMVGFSVALWGALLVHYSSLLFAFSIGVYGIVRFYSNSPRMSVVATWVIGQIFAIGLVWFLFRTHIASLKKVGLPQNIADTWLRKSIFHPGEDNPLWFVIRGSIRFFHYFFGNGAVGAIGLIVFFAGLILLFRGRTRSSRLNTGPRLIGLFLTLPFVGAIAAAFAGLYPYGGSRHDIFLAPFAIAAISIAVSAWKPGLRWVRCSVVLIALAAGNFFLSPSGPFIKPRNQSKGLMQEAIAALRNTPDPVIFTDYQGGQLLSYYLCGKTAVQLSLPPYQPLTRTDCGNQVVISTSPEFWIFHANDFRAALKQIAPTDTNASNPNILVFQAGWSVDKEDDLLRVLQSLGCNSPRKFGSNILECRVDTRLQAQAIPEK